MPLAACAVWPRSLHSANGPDCRASTPGSEHLVLKKALDAMISLKQKIAALQQIRR